MMAIQDCRRLQRGDQGPTVQAYQEAANVWLIYQERQGITSCDGQTRPALLEEDGIFGPRTERVTAWLRCRFALPPSGIADSTLLVALAQKLAEAQLGTLFLGASVGGASGTPGCVVPLVYAPSDLANQYRLEHGLPLIFVPTEPSPSPEPTPEPSTGGQSLPWPWLIGVGVLVAIGARFLRRRQ